MTTDHDQMSTTTVTLAVSGMTCAACAARITKRLNNSTASRRASTTPSNKRQ